MGGCSEQGFLKTCSPQGRMKGTGRLTQTWGHKCQASMSPRHSPRLAILSTFSGSLSVCLTCEEIDWPLKFIQSSPPPFSNLTPKCKISANHPDPRQKAPPFLFCWFPTKLQLRAAHHMQGIHFNHLTSSGRVITFGISFLFVLQES